MTQLLIGLWHGLGALCGESEVSNSVGWGEELRGQWSLTGGWGLR